MPELLILRHAKSSWDDPHLRDFDRPLNKRGAKAAPEMGQRLKEYGWLPQAVLSSPARRAWLTIEEVAASLDFPQEDIIRENRIYNADLPELRRILQEQPQSCHKLLLCGHNPGLTELFNDLCDHWWENLPTAGMALLQWPGSWQQLPYHQAQLLWHASPRNKTSPRPRENNGS